MAKIHFIVSDGCLFSGISGLIDSFTIANRWHSANTGDKTQSLFETKILSPDGKAALVSGGYKIMPDGGLSDHDQAEMIIIPPFLPNAEPFGENANQLRDWIVDRYRQGVPIASLCTGAFVLAQTGLLDGRIATTHWLFARLFRNRYPKVRLKPELILTHDDGLICSGAVSAFLNLGLYIIETFGSVQLSSQCSKALLVDSNRLSQAPYAIFNLHKGHGDIDILKAQQWMESNFAENLKMDSLAGQVGISPRHFVRRFKKATGETPLNYLQQIRIENAKMKLETSKETIDEITQAIGYENSGTFRKLFNEYTGLSPREYRSKFSRPHSAA